MHNRDNIQLVSIGVPTYGRYRELERLLAQLRDQTHTDLDIIVADNHHPDTRSFELARKLSQSDRRIRAYRHQTDIGAVANHDFVREQAQSNLFMWMGDDDEISPTYVANCLAALHANPEAVLAGGVGHRYRNGVFWYDYAPWDNSGQPTTKRLKDLIDICFTHHWVFEHYWYGIFYKNKGPKNVSPDFKSILSHCFHLTEQGTIVHAPNAEMIKHTTEKELANHAVGTAYRRWRLLRPFKDGDYRCLEQGIPVTLQMAHTILRSRNLTFLEKNQLFVHLMRRFVNDPLRCEVKRRLKKLPPPQL